jgi:hypothetical protein
MKKNVLDALVKEFEKKGWSDVVMIIYSLMCVNLRLRSENARLRDEKIDETKMNDWAIALMEEVANVSTDSCEV